jgi:hypothetical protein
VIALPLVVIQQNIASYPVALSNYFYLESKPHPSLGKFQEADLALGIGRLFRSRYAFVRPTSVLVPSHVPLPLTPLNRRTQASGVLFCINHGESCELSEGCGGVS